MVGLRARTGVIVRAGRPRAVVGVVRAIGAVWIAASYGCGMTPVQAPSPAEPVPAAAAFRQLVESSVLETADVLALVIPSGDVLVADQVVLVVRVAAPAARVMEVLREVEAYPRRVDQVQRVDVLSRREDGVTFEMELEVPLQNLVYELAFSYPSDDRIDVVGLSGALEGGRFSWEVFPRERGSTLVYSTKATLGDDAGLLVNAILKIHPDLQEGLMFAQGLRFIRSIRDAAEMGEERMDDKGDHGDA